MPPVSSGFGRFPEPSKDGNGLFDAVVIGSGNRADPLDQGGTTTNYLYMIKDRQTATASGVLTQQPR